MSKYTKREDGEGWEIRNRVPFKVACCDCGLVHLMVIHSPGQRKGKVLGIAARRDERATSAKRRKGRVPPVRHKLRVRVAASATAKKSVE